MKLKAKQLGIESKVMFMGVRKDINVLLQMMDAFLFPSLYEGLGISLIEAQASGLPCIISHTIPQEAVLTKNVEVISLKASMDTWVKTILSKRYFERRDNSGDIIRNHFDIHSLAEQMEAFYCEGLYMCEKEQ